MTELMKQRTKTLTILRVEALHFISNFLLSQVNNGPELEHQVAKYPKGF